MSWVWTRASEIARAGGDRVAIYHGDEQTRFCDLLAQAEEISATLSVSPGDRVILCAENSATFAAIVAAIWRQGAIATIVASDAPLRHLQHAIETVSPTTIFCEDPQMRADTHARWIEGEQPGSAHSAATTAIAATAPASVMFTSGSTGLPKGVTQSAFNLIDGSERMSALLGLGPDDRILCPIPFAFDYGWGQLMSLLLQGTPLVLPAPRNAFGLCEALSSHKPTVLAGVPAVFSDLLSGLSPIRETERSSVRLITNTGSKIQPPLFDTLVETFPKAQISLNYGLTETYRSASLSTEHAHDHSDSVGFAVPGVEIAIVSPDGQRCAPGEEGEVVHHGAGAFLGYWNNPEATQKVRTEGPDGRVSVRTGDLGRIDDAGFLYIHGRRDRQIKSMGVRVSPDEVETILFESGLLSEVAITAEPHDMLGQMILAWVVPRQPCATPIDEKAFLREIKRYARAQMSPYMQPRDYIVQASLPRTPSKKIAYASLRREEQQ